MHRIPRSASVSLAALALLAGCTFTHTKHVTPSLRALPAAEKLPLTLGVRYTPSFVASERAHSYSSHKWVVRIGEDSVAMLDRVLPLLFANVIRMPETPGAAPAVDLVLEPAIEHFDFFFREKAPSPSASVVYRMSVFEPSGRLVSSWTVEGRAAFEPTPAPPPPAADGEEPPSPRKRDEYDHAADNLDDAARKIVARFRADAQIDAWLASRSAGPPPVLEGVSVDATIEDLALTIPGAEPSLVANGIVPVKVRVTNTGASGAALGRGPACLVLPGGQVLHDVGPSGVLSQLEVKAAKSAGNTVFWFGLIGALANMSRDSSKKEALPHVGQALERNALGAATLAPGESVERFLYFPGDEPPAAAILSVWLTGAELRSAKFERPVRPLPPPPAPRSEDPSPTQ